MDEETERRRAADACAKRNPTAANTPENRVAFAAVFAETLSADTVVQLHILGFERAVSRAIRLHASTLALCEAAEVTPMLCPRQFHGHLDDDVRKFVFACARDNVVTCEKLLFLAELDAYDEKVADCAHNAGEDARLLLYVLCAHRKSN